MGVRVQRARATVVELDDLDAGDVLPDESAVAAARVQLAQPGEQDSVAQAVLQRLELGREFRMQQRGDAVRLGVVERPVEQQVGVGAEPLGSALLPRDRVMAGEPHPKPAGGQLVGGDGAVVDHESGDARVGGRAVHLERVGAGRVRR